MECQGNTWKENKLMTEFETVVLHILRIAEAEKKGTGKTELERTQL